MQKIKRKEKRKKIKNLKMLRDDMEGILDDCILSLTRKDYDSFKDYKKDMETLTIKDIKGEIKK